MSELPEQRSSKERVYAVCEYLRGKPCSRCSSSVDTPYGKGVQGCYAVAEETIAVVERTRTTDEPTSAQVSKERLAQALRNLRDVAHREVSPRYSAALDEAFTLADIALGEFDSEGEVSREADVGPGGGVRATHATGSAPSKPGAAEPPSAPASKQGHYYNSGYCATACGYIVRERGVESWPATFAFSEHADRFVAMMNGDAEPPSDDLAFPLDARVREVFGQTEGTIVAIDTRYEVECTDGKHRFYWHRQLERVAETKDAAQPMHGGALVAPGRCDNGECWCHGGISAETSAAPGDDLPQRLRAMRDVPADKLHRPFDAAAKNRGGK